MATGICLFRLKSLVDICRIEDGCKMVDDGRMTAADMFVVFWFQDGFWMFTR